MRKMERNEILLSRDGGGNSNGNNGEGFIDRSKVRILLCDNDSKSSEEVFVLLCKCSYQVTSVRSPRQVIDALNAEGPDIDIILSEVDLPMAKGFKMLKYIMRDKDLRRIPVIMMSAQDEVALVVKCLRLGAADYLVKPLRTNELLNLWTHMWRRRRMLGLAEKNIMNCEFDLVPSDPSDANTNSTTLFSDDTDEKSRKSSNAEMSVSVTREDESNVRIASGLANTQLVILSDDHSNVPEVNEKRGPKKSELRIGQSSAFFTYVKSNIFRNTNETTPPLLDNKLSSRMDSITIDLTDENENSTQYVRLEENIHTINNTFPDSKKPELPEAQLLGNSKNNFHHDVSSYNISNPYSAYPYYLNVSHFPPHHMAGMASFPYYPMSVCLPNQMPPPWPPYGSSSSNNVHKKLDRREAALLKFRQKRKERCFDKKIRYVNRKKLAERRPRVRGQFVRKINGIDVDLNGQPTSTDFDEDDDDDEDEEEDQDQAGGDSDPENDYVVFNG